MTKSCQCQQENRKSELSGEGQELRRKPGSPTQKTACCACGWPVNASYSNFSNYFVNCNYFFCLYLLSRIRFSRILAITQTALICRIFHFRVNSANLNIRVEKFLHVMQPKFHWRIRLSGLYVYTTWFGKLCIGQLSLPSLRGRWMSSDPCISVNFGGGDY